MTILMGLFGAWLLFGKKGQMLYLVLKLLQEEKSKPKPQPRRIAGR